MQAREPFSMPIDLGPSGKGSLKFKPAMESSEAVLVKYPLPFNLNVENQGGRAVVTKDGPGGERVGDMLRESLPTCGQSPIGWFDGTMH